MSCNALYEKWIIYFVSNIPSLRGRDNIQGSAPKRFYQILAMSHRSGYKNFSNRKSFKASSNTCCQSRNCAALFLSRFTFGAFVRANATQILSPVTAHTAQNEKNIFDGAQIVHVFIVGLYHHSDRWIRFSRKCGQLLHL